MVTITHPAALTRGPPTGSTSAGITYPQDSEITGRRWQANGQIALRNSWVVMTIP